MRAVLYSEPLTYSIRDLADRALQPGEVRLAVLRVGVCGTDLHLHRGHFGARYPHTPGHEIVGEVAEIAHGVGGFVVGDRVVVEDGVYCGMCGACKAGKSLYCANIRALGVSLPGGTAEQLVVPAMKCYPVGPLEPDIAVLAEPLACVIHAMDRLAMPPGARVLVLGAGTAGQLLAVMARRNGAAHVTVAGSSEFKLGIAQELGADRTIAITREPGAALHAMTAAEPEGFDVVIDATGAVPMLETAIEAASVGGTILVYGVAEADKRISVSPFDIFKRELTIMGSYAQALNIGRAVTYLGTLPPTIGRLITHRFRLADYGLAIDALGSSECIKAIVVPGDR
ncbi:D-arabinitol dehydrogenase (NADP+) [Microbacterium sp. BE35]|uniref:zinc-dependent alcohol dehydrogenase family protein n=1 Tax=Microbacterium sp. BE35 TaxID=2817773 RepID=UPI00285511F7|nr:zinc-dependent alcohol dehydrogenase family protein [Microbacterium sp. BE35]MDR7188257.1 D-arabinitol dehydrogenase (NADP+) [Microbacterium sp. BE35]